MIQTTLNVPLEVKPESVSYLSSLIEQFRGSEDKPDGGQSDNFSRVSLKMPTVHFLSMSVFESDQYDPLFMIEANFDGESGVFWKQFEAFARDTLRDMLRCCREPLDEDAELFRTVTASGSTTEIAPYLVARTEFPSVFHHGNRGLSRDRIREDADLFRAVRKELDEPANQDPGAYRSQSSERIHSSLRKCMRTSFPWLDQPAPVRVSKFQRIMDYSKLLGVAMLIVFLLSLPGVIFSMLLPNPNYAAGIFLFFLFFVLLNFSMRKPLEGTGVQTTFNLIAFLVRNAIWIAVGLLIILAAILVVILAMAFLIDLVTGVIPGQMRDWWWPIWRQLLLGQYSLLLVIPGLVAWLRYLEKRDSTRYKPQIKEEVVADMARREDWIPQNHMVSVVNIRPGILRTIIIHIGHATLGRLLRVTSTEGYLGSMRTVHFAHWAFQNNASRLVFFSNFDQSWGSYLDDFIEKAHVGLTLAWGCGVGFPATRFLIYDGASHGRLFKAWALASRTATRFWYSAYPELSVDQIERNHRVANGLRKEILPTEELENWMRDL